MQGILIAGPSPDAHTTQLNVSLWIFATKQVKFTILVHHAQQTSGHFAYLFRSSHNQYSILQLRFTCQGSEPCMLNRDFPTHC